MSGKKHRPEQPIANLRQTDVIVGDGKSMRKSYWDAGIKDATCYSWRTELGGLKRSRARLLKDLEREKRVTGKGPNNILIGDSSHKFDPCSLQGSSNIAI